MCWIPTNLWFFSHILLEVNDDRIKFLAQNNFILNSFLLSWFLIIIRFRDITRAKNSLQAERSKSYLCLPDGLSTSKDLKQRFSINKVFILSETRLHRIFSTLSIKLPYFLTMR